MAILLTVVTTTVMMLTVIQTIVVIPAIAAIRARHQPATRMVAIMVAIRTQEILVIQAILMAVVVIMVHLVVHWPPKMEQANQILIRTVHRIRTTLADTLVQRS